MVVSFGERLEAIDPSELSGALLDSTGLAAVAAVGGAGGPAEVEPSTIMHSTRSESSVTAADRNLSPQSFVGTVLSPIAQSPNAMGDTAGGGGGSNAAAVVPLSSSGTPPNPNATPNPANAHAPIAMNASGTPISPALPLSPAGGVVSGSSGGGSGSGSRSGAPTATSSPLSPASSNDLSSPMPASPALDSPHAKAVDAATAAGITIRSPEDSSSPPAAAAAIAAQFSLPLSPLSPSVANNAATATGATATPNATLSAPTDPGLSVLLSPQSTLASPQFASAPHATLTVSVKSPGSAISPASVSAPTASASPTVPFTPRALQSFTERIYRGKVVDRFPLHDHRSVPFPPGIAMFCIPEDITLSITPDLPLFYYFAATGANGVRLYGACLKFFEPLPTHVAAQVWAEEKLVQEKKKQMARALTMLNAGGTLTQGQGASVAINTPASNKSNPLSSSSASSGGSSQGSPATLADNLAALQTSASAALYAHCLEPAEKRPLIYASKCLCLLSTYAFLRQFREFLTGVYRMSLTPSPLPLERVICNFMQEVPVPPLGEIKVQYSLPTDGAGIITFARPPPNNPFGFHHFPIQLLFQSLDFAHVLLLFECMLCERRILLLSSRISKLTMVSEALLALLYPFYWSHVYIPLLPKALIDFLHAPMPFIIGMQANFLDSAAHGIQGLKGEILDDLVIVYLDSNRIEMPGVATKKPPSLPTKEKKKLWKKLKSCALFKQHPQQQPHDSKGLTGSDPHAYGFDQANEYERKLFDTMDLAFSNAPLPIEIEKAAAESAARVNLAHLLNEEVSKNTNASPAGGSHSSAKRSLHNHSSSHKDSPPSVPHPNFSSGLHGGGASATHSSAHLHSTARSHRSNSHSSNVRITSPSALSHGARGSGSFSSPSSKGGGAPSTPNSPPAMVATSLLDSDSESIDYLICSAFFRVFVSLLKDYRAFLIFPTASQPFPDPCFDMAGFLKTIEGGGKSNGVADWFAEFGKTQAFRRFCEERIFPTPRDAKRVLFFDESILAKRNRSKFLSRKFETPFLKDRSGDLVKTFVAPSADATNLPNQGVKKYVYPLWPTLDPSLYSKPRIITPLLIKQGTTGSGSRSGMLLHKSSGISLGSWQPKKPAAGSSSKDSSRRTSFNTASQSTSAEQVVATLWFVLFTAIAGENSKADALDTAFQVLINLRQNGLTPEEEIFPCFMFACGSCGVPERAIDVLREMQNSGFQPDTNTYAALLQVFTMNGDHKGHEALASLKPSIDAQTNTAGGSIVSTIKAKLSQVTKTEAASSHKSPPPPASSSTPPTYYTHPGTDPRDPSSPLSSPQPLKIAEISEADRITMFALQFEMMFPGLDVSTEESCPNEACGKVILDHHIRAGWTANANDYTTACPFCGERFVARFAVRSKAWVAEQKSSGTTLKIDASTPMKPSQQQPQHTSSSSAHSEDQIGLLSPDSLAMLRATQTLLASQNLILPALDSSADRMRHLSGSSDAGAGSFHASTPFHPPTGQTSPPPPSSSPPPQRNPPIYCEYLSPRVLKKEVMHLLEVKSARYFTSRDFRKNSPVLFWNLMWSATTNTLRRRRVECKQETKFDVHIAVCCSLFCFLRHFTNQCLPIDFLIRREPKPLQRATHLSESCSTPQSTKARTTTNGLVRRRRRQQSGSSFASSVKSASESTRSLDSASSFSPPLDDFERTIAMARASGVGRSFGYGTGGMVSGAGAVGISLGSMLRTRDTSMQRPSAMEATREEDEQDESEGEDDDEDDGEYGAESEARFQQPLSTPPIGPMSPQLDQEQMSPAMLSPPAARNLSPTRSDQTMHPNQEAPHSNPDGLGLASPHVRAQNAATNEADAATVIEPAAAL